MSTPKTNLKKSSATTTFENTVNIGVLKVDSTPINPLFVVEATVGQAALASGGSAILYSALNSTSKYKIREMRLSGAGTNFSGTSGDRNISITDGTTTWSVIPAATAESLAFTNWGSTGLPAPATAAALTTASTAGANLVAKYSGGTTDFTAGSLTLILTLEKVA